MYIALLIVHGLCAVALLGAVGTLGRTHAGAPIKLGVLQPQSGPLAAEGQALVRAAPRQVDFVFELAEARLARGDRARALDAVARLEASAAGDPDTLARVADFYEKIDERARALALVARLAQTNANDPTFLVDLGDRYFQQGDRKRAVETWKRLETTVRPRARALLAWRLLHILLAGPLFRLRLLWL